MAGWKRGLLAAALLILFVATVFFWVKWSVFNSYVSTFARETGTNDYLVKALAGVLLIPFHLGIYYALQFWNRRKRWTGFATLIALYVFYNAGLYLATKDHYRGKWYVRTPDGIVYYDHRTESGTDPVYGRDLKKVTPEKLPQLLALEKGCNAVDPGNANFFNPQTGSVQVWHYQRPDGTYEFFDGPCHHPKLGVRFKPVTRAVVREWRSQQEAAREETKRQQQGKRRAKTSRGTEEAHPDLSTLAGTNPKQTPDPRPEPEPEATPKPTPTSSPTPEPVPEPDQKPATETPHDESERSFQKKYVNGWVLERLQTENRPVTLIAMYGTTAFEDRIVSALRERGVNAQTGVLKRVAYKTDPLFQRLKGGDGETQRALGLSRLDGNLVLCRLSLGELTETPDGYLTKAYLSVAIVPLGGGRPARREFEAEGGGFTQADAEEQARERARSDFLASPLADRLSRR